MNFVIPGQPPQDDNGHGTHVASIAAAVTNNSKGVAGVAPGARIMPVKLLDQNGTSFGEDTVSQGILWAADHGAQLINLSLGDFGQEVLGASFGDAMEYEWSKGAIPVVAAGNNIVLLSGYSSEHSIVVRATTGNDTKAYYSDGVGRAQWGLAAPPGADDGNQEDDILSTYWVQGKQNQYVYLAGTSMAAPHVSGPVAVLRSLGLTPQQTVERLLATAKDVGPTGRDSTFGAGRLDLAGAVEGLGGGGGAPHTSGGGGSSKSSGGTVQRRPTATPGVTPAAGAVGSPVPTGGASPAPASSPQAAAPVIGSHRRTETSRSPVLPLAGSAVAVAAGSSLLAVYGLRGRA